MMNSIVERLRGFKSAAAQVWAHEAAALIEQQAKRIKELEAANLKLIRGDFNQMCSYCGWETPGNGDSWEELMAHIHCCDKHPLKKANDELSALRQRERDYRDVTSGCPDVLVARELLSKNFPALYKEMEARQQLATLRQRIDDAPVVAHITEDGKVFSNGFVRDTDKPLISKEDLQK